MKTTHFETNRDLVTAIRRTAGPMHVDALIGQDHDPIPVQAVKADLIWRLETDTCPTDPACMFLCEYPDGMKRLLAAD